MFIDGAEDAVFLTIRAREKIDAWRRGGSGWRRKPDGTGEGGPRR